MRAWDFYTSKELKPRGWLRRQLVLQAEGLNGNLDKVWPDVRDSAWIGGEREGWERVPYWLDGFIPLAYLLKDQNMIDRAKTYIDAILHNQKPDGWSCPCSDEERATYDTWAVQLISKVLVVYYNCSGDERIPPAVYRLLKNYYALLKSGACRLFGWGQFRWFEACVAIQFTYDRYPEPWLLELTRILKTQGADYNDFTEIWKRPLNLCRMETHIVNIAMMLKSEAVSCDLLGEKYTDNGEYLYGILEKHHGMPVGTITGDENLAGVSPIQGTELCGVVEQMYSCELLYAYSSDAKWAERLEKLAFNALPATISDDMWTHQYLQMSNQIACKRFPGKPVFRTNGPEAHLFGLEPNYGCCTANFGQGWPKFALSAFLHRGNTVLNSIAVPAELHTANQHIILDTDYPFDHSFTYTVKAEKAFDFVIRVPSFARNVTVNGVAYAGSELQFSFEAGAETQLKVHYEVTPQLQTRPNGLHTAQWGSLIFSVPIDHKKEMHEYERDGVERKYPYCDYSYLPLSDWNYAYCDDAFVPQFLGVGKIPFSSVTPPVVLKARVQKINWGLEDGYELVCAKFPESTEPLTQPEAILLYPYGCAKLRMTEIPRI